MQEDAGNRWADTQQPSEPSACRSSASYTVLSTGAGWLTEAAESGNVASTSVLEPAALALSPLTGELEWTALPLNTCLPMYLDASQPLSASQPADTSGEATSRPAAASPEYPQPTTTASQTGTQTAYDRFKQQLYKATGTKYVLSLDFVDQQLVSAPTRWYNRGNARFDFGIDQDLWSGGTLSFDARGGNSDSLDALEGNGVNTNQFAATPAPIFVLRLAYYQRFFDDRVVVRIGKFDVGDFVDYNRFGSYNFLAYSFAHNDSIPLPGNTLGMLVTVRPTGWLTLRGGFSNNAQTPAEAGFNTLDEGDFFQIYEVALSPKVYGQDGTYRFIGWYDNRTLPQLTGGGEENGRGGFALSFDQNITKHFGLFTRYGYTNQDALPVQQYWSAGFLWTGLIPSQPKGSLALGVLQNLYGEGHNATTPDASSSETLIETYYQYELNPYTSIIPTLQFVLDPGGTHRQSEVILALHINLHF